MQRRAWQRPSGLAPGREVRTQGSAALVRQPQRSIGVHAADAAGSCRCNRTVRGIDRHSVAMLDGWVSSGWRVEQPQSARGQRETLATIAAPLAAWERLPPLPHLPAAVVHGPALPLPAPQLLAERAVRAGGCVVAMRRSPARESAMAAVKVLLLRSDSWTMRVSHVLIALAFVGWVIPQVCADLDDAICAA